MNSSHILNRIEEEIRCLSDLEQFYPKRLDMLKKGNQAQRQGQYRRTIFYYTLYLEILSTYKKVKKSELHPSLFNQQSEKIELIVVCSLYWKISTIYDQLKDLTEELQKSLNQFKIFSTGYPYHNSNLEILHKYIKTKKVRHKEVFHKTYREMKLYSNQCYIATHCFGHNHPVTIELRRFKTSLMPYRMGRIIISQYYHYSPKFIFILNRYPLANFLVTKVIMKPLLLSIAFAHKNGYII